jgi:hypothetical protein
MLYGLDCLCAAQGLQGSPLSNYYCGVRGGVGGGALSRDHAWYASKCLSSYGGRGEGFGGKTWKPVQSHLSNIFMIAIFSRGGTKALQYTIASL